ncbi:hypothetical protein QTP88_028912 [Uroleucon formosanum]
MRCEHNRYAINPIHMIFLRIFFTMDTINMKSKCYDKLHKNRKKLAKNTSFLSDEQYNEYLIQNNHKKLIQMSKIKYQTQNNT